MARFRRALDWWAGELIGLFPISLRSVFAPDPDSLTLYYYDGRFRVVHNSDHGTPAASQAPPPNDTGNVTPWPLFTKPSGSDLSGRATVWLPYSACLERHFTVPAAAAADLEHIVRLELERATPFKAADVYSSYITSPCPEDRTTLFIRHYIAKRETIAAVQAKLQDTGIEVRTITPLDKTGKKPLPINFLSDRAGTQARKSGGIAALTAIAFLLIAVATAVAVIRSERALSDLAAEANKARSEWQARESSDMPALAKRDEANAIATLKGKYIPTVLLLNEITKRLPDDVHLSDLKISDGTVLISGLGRDTSRLIPLLEGSELFTNVEMAAPVTVDPATDKDRFSIRFVLRSNTPRAQESAEEEPL